MNEKFDLNSIDDMLNNPFKNMDIKEKPAAKNEEHTEKPLQQEFLNTQAPPIIAGHEADQLSMEKNHPIQLRLLSAEKNLISMEKKMEYLKKTIEQQNERIELMEKELGLFRQNLSDR